jgi:hypothetical protein
VRVIVLQLTHARGGSCALLLKRRLVQRMMSAKRTLPRRTRSQPNVWSHTTLNKLRSSTSLWSEQRGLQLVGEQTVIETLQHLRAQDIRTLWGCAARFKRCS